MLLLIFGGGDLCRRQRPEPPIWEYKVVFQFKLSITLLSWLSAFWLQRIRNTYHLCRHVGRGRTKIPSQISLIRRQYISVVEMATCSVMIWNSFEREYFCFSDFTWHSTISDSILFPPITIPVALIIILKFTLSFPSKHKPFSLFFPSYPSLFAS